MSRSAFEIKCRRKLLSVIAACALALAGFAGTANAQVSTGWTEKLLHDFTCVNPDGCTPDQQGPLLLSGGFLYGTTAAGGANGGGSVYKLDPVTGQMTTLYSFTINFQGGSGFSPEGSLVQDAQGNLYGTTSSGGPYDHGTLWKLTPGGTFTLLNAFQNHTDGSGQAGPIAMDANGNIYGASFEGGDLNCNSGSGCGSVYKVSPAGVLTVLHRFSGGADGVSPSVGALDGAGNVYGVTPYGGDAQCGGGNGCGVVFRITPSGVFSVLHAFTGGTDGVTPGPGALIRDAAGNLYGVTEAGGNSGCSGLGCGTVFKVTPSGTEQVLHSFAAGADGYFPYGGLAIDTAGNLYGTTYWGGIGNCYPGEQGCGTVFRLGTAGQKTTLYDFKAIPDADRPWANLARDAQGVLYGTTPYGGTGNDCDGNCGTVYEVIPPPVTPP